MTIKKIVLTSAAFGFAASNALAMEKAIVFSIDKRTILDYIEYNPNDPAKSLPPRANDLAKILVFEHHPDLKPNDLEYQGTLKAINKIHLKNNPDKRILAETVLGYSMKKNNYTTCTFTSGEQAIIHYEKKPSTDLCTQTEEAYNKLWWWQKSNL